MSLQLDVFSPTAECPRCQTFKTRTLYIFHQVSRRRHQCKKCHFRFNTEMLDVETNEPTAERITAAKAKNELLKYLPHHFLPDVDRRGHWIRIGHPFRIAQHGQLAAVYRCLKCGKFTVMRRGKYLSRGKCKCMKAATISDMARAHGVPPCVAINRISVLRWSVQRAVSEPVRRKKKRDRGDKCE